MSNRVTVNIYGQEYTIAGDATQDKMIQVASWVDNKMREIDEAVGNSLPTTSLAVLSAVNIANEYFTVKEELDENKKITEQLEGDTQHYIQLWDEAKKNFIEYKEENAAIQKQKEQLTMKLAAKEKEGEKVMQAQSSIQEEIEKKVRVRLDEEKMRYKDLENNFFDLQMENIRIKSELEKLRGKMK